MDEDDKYSLHCEASDRITKAGKQRRSPNEECTPTWEPCRSGATKGYN